MNINQVIFSADKFHLENLVKPNLLSTKEIITKINETIKSILDSKLEGFAGQKMKDYDDMSLNPFKLIKENITFKGEEIVVLTKDNSLLFIKFDKGQFLIEKRKADSPDAPKYSTADSVEELEVSEDVEGVWVLNSSFAENLQLKKTEHTSQEGLRNFFHYCSEDSSKAPFHHECQMPGACAFHAMQSFVGFDFSSIRDFGDFRVKQQLPDIIKAVVDEEVRKRQPDLKTLVQTKLNTLSSEEVDNLTRKFPYKIDSDPNTTKSNQKELVSSGLLNQKIIFTKGELATPALRYALKKQVDSEMRDNPISIPPEEYEEIKASSKVQAEALRRAEEQVYDPSGLRGTSVTDVQDFLREKKGAETDIRVFYQGQSDALSDYIQEKLGSTDRLFIGAGEHTSTWRRDDQGLWWSIDSVNSNQENFTQEQAVAKIKNGFVRETDDQEHSQPFSIMSMA